MIPAILKAGWMNKGLLFWFLTASFVTSFMYHFLLKRHIYFPVNSIALEIGIELGIAAVVLILCIGMGAVATHPFSKRFQRAIFGILMFAVFAFALENKYYYMATTAVLLSLLPGLFEAYYMWSAPPLVRVPVPPRMIPPPPAIVRRRIRYAI